MNDIADFEKEYRAQLDQAIADAGMPAALLLQFSFESCIRKDADGKKELYLVTRKADQAKALLRITQNYPEEDALEEARLLEMLDHPAIPKVYAAYEQAGRRYVVRSYVDGRTLHEVVKVGGRLPARDLYGVVLKLCDVLGYLHGLTPPVIHRDIKPQNIIVDGAGGIHLIDFGIARLHKPGQRKDTAIIVSERYASPESFGYAQTSHLADIYSLGVVMLFMATGREENAGLEAQIKDKGLRRLVERCIAFDPKARCQSVQDIARQIRRLQRGSRNRRRALYCLLIALVVACAALPAYYAGQLAGEAAGRPAAYREGYAAGYADAPDWKIRQVAYVPGAGNLPGNLTAGGFVTRSENSIYYIHAGEVFGMALDGSKSVLLMEGKHAKSLCYYEGILYFNTPSYIGRLDPETGEAQPLAYISADTLHLDGGRIYFANQGDLLTLYGMDLDGGNVTRMNDVQHLTYLNIADGRMYYVPGKEGDKRVLYSCNVDGSDLRQLTADPCAWMSVYDGRVYCRQTDLSGNNGVLMSMALDGSDAQVLRKESPSYVNATQSGVFYLSPSTREEGRTLECVSHDGRLRFTVLAGSMGAFNVAGDWVFYENTADDGNLWRIRLNGTENQQV